MKESLKGRAYDVVGSEVGRGTRDRSQTRTLCDAPAGIELEGIVLVVHFDNRQVSH